MTDVKALSDKLLANFEAACGQDYVGMAAHVLPNLPNGCSWGLVPTHQARAIGLHREKSTHPEFFVYEIRNGYIVYTDYMSLVGNIQKSFPIFDERTLNIAAKMRTDAAEGLDRRLSRNPGPTSLGFFNLNDSNTVTIKGVSYPAYNVSLDTLCSSLSKHGYCFSSGNSFATPEQALANPEAFLKEFCILAPSGNAVLVNVVKVPAAA